MALRYHLTACFPSSFLELDLPPLVDTRLCGSSLTFVAVSLVLLYSKDARFQVCPRAVIGCRYSEAIRKKPLDVFGVCFALKVLGSRLIVHSGNFILLIWDMRSILDTKPPAV